MNLTQLQQIVPSLYPGATYLASWDASVDADGAATIASWNTGLGVQPTSEQLSAALAQMQLTQARTVQKATLYAAYTAARFGATVSLSVGTATVPFPTDQLTQQNIIGYLVAFDAETAPAGMPLARCRC